MATFDCAEILKDEIKPEQRPEVWVHVCAEFVYFFMDLISRFAFSIFGDVGERELQSKLRPLVAKCFVAGLFDHWPEDLKSKIEQEFLENLNNTEAEYQKCPSLSDEDKNELYTGNGMIDALARKVAELMGSPSNPVVVQQVVHAVRTKLKTLNFEALVRAAGEQLVSSREILGVRTQRSAPSQIARSLVERWVARDDFSPLPENALSASFWPKYQRKWRLYREATVLMVLLKKEQEDARYAELVKEYERLIYPSDKPTPEALAKLEALRTAMQDIARLGGEDLRSRSKWPALTWAREWFEELGELPRNPVDCMVFGIACMLLWIAVAKTVEDLAKQGLVP